MRKYYSSQGTRNFRKKKQKWPSRKVDRDENFPFISEQTLYAMMDNSDAGRRADPRARPNYIITSTQYSQLVSEIYWHRVVQGVQLKGLTTPE